MYLINKHIWILIIFLAHAAIVCAQGTLLTGTVMGSSPSVEYVTFGPTTTQNLPADAFDGNLDTYFASYDRSYTWAGLDLGSRHVITRVGWSPRNDGNGPRRVVLGLFEGANRADFMDAVPLYLIDRQGTIGVMDEADVHCSLGFRYVRYVGPNDARCNIAELAFYGYEGDGDSTLLYRPTDLPCVVIHTQNNQEPYDKEHYIQSQVTIIAPDGSVLRDTAGLRLRGNASTGFPKKPYRMKFNSKHHVLGSPAKAKNWTLINNYGDKTLMRNMVAFHLSEKLHMPYTPFCRAVDVMVNGEYKGCYQLCDKIEVKKGRVAIDEMAENDRSGEALTGGYLWEIDGYANTEPAPFYSQHYMPITLHSPEDDKIVPEQRTYFENYFNQLENRVYVANANQTSWREYLDYATFARYFLINQACGNPDVFWSCYMYKKRNDLKAYTGPVWDFDIAFDNDYRQYPMANHSQFIMGGADNTEPFVRHIIYADQKSRDELAGYWAAARGEGVSAEQLNAFVDSVAAALDASQRLNFMRWPILNERVHMNPVALGSYEAEVNRLKQFISMRINWMDSQLNYTGHSDNPQVNADEGTEYTVYTIQGQLLYSGQTLPQLPQGVYIVRHKSGANVMIR